MESRDDAPFVVIDLEVDNLVSWPGQFPGPSRLVTDVIRELDEAADRKKPVLIPVNCLGGAFTAGVDLWAAINGHRKSGLPVVVEITGNAASAAALFILAASYVVIWPHRGYVSLHGPYGAPADSPAANPPPGVASSTLTVLCDPEVRSRGVSPWIMMRSLLEQGTFGGSVELDKWLGDEMVDLDASAAVRWGFADEVAFLRGREVALAYARGWTVRSPRREALAALGRGWQPGSSLSEG